MNRADLVNAMANETAFSKKDVEKVLNSFINVVSNEMANKGKVQLVGFGTFETRQRAAINPQTKEEIKIPACTAPAFKAGKALKDKVNK